MTRRPVIAQRIAASEPSLFGYARPPAGAPNVVFILLDDNGEILTPLPK